MNAIFKTELDSSDIKAIKEFCNIADYCAIEQQIGFPEILYKSKISYFWLKADDNSIKCFCQIHENFKSAHILFGPVCNDKDLMIEAVLKIVEHYKAGHFWYLGIQPYRKTGYEADYIEYRLVNKIRIDYILDNENTKSSLEIDLRDSIDVIFQKFSKGHKSAVKKAIKCGLRVEEVNNENALTSFISVYLKMCKVRKVKPHSAEEIEGICNYVKKNNMGTILLAVDQENRVLGGSVFVYQGISVRYLLSASEPDRKDIPIAHIIIFKAIEKAKEDKFRYFDFWGYNHFAKAEDQIYLVNRFKKGFGGYYTFLMKKMNISLIPCGFQIYMMYNRTKEGLTSLKNLVIHKN
jgi:lipid II:glycine glycyltransferase (peptidoglycan interpeptide bridge formation enzyme)